MTVQIETTQTSHRTGKVAFLRICAVEVKKLTPKRVIAGDYAYDRKTGERLFCSGSRYHKRILPPLP